MPLSTTLSALKKFAAKESLFEKLINRLGPFWGPHKSINLVTILDLLGVKGCLAALKAVEDQLRAKQIAVAFGMWCGKYKYKDKYWEGYLEKKMENIIYDVFVLSVSALCKHDAYHTGSYRAKLIEKDKKEQIEKLRDLLS